MLQLHSVFLYNNQKIVRGRIHKNIFFRSQMKIPQLPFLSISKLQKKQLWLSWSSLFKREREREGERERELFKCTTTINRQVTSTVQCTSLSLTHRQIIVLLQSKMTRNMEVLLKRKSFLILKVTSLAN